MEENMRLLIINDNATNLMLLTIIAQRLDGVGVEGCQTPLRALELL